jgi:hypothetical protein
MQARSTRLRNSRTLPGQLWATSRSSALLLNNTRERRARPAFMKWWTSIGTSSDRSPRPGRVDREDGEAVIEILAETLLLDCDVEVAVRGRDDAGVDGDRAAAADALDAPLLEHAQQFDLHVVRHVADLVEEQGAAVGFLEAARALDVGAGEAALFVAEQFGFDEVARDGAAIDGDAGRGGAAAGGVDGARDHFLAAARRAGDDHGRVGGADLRDLGAHFAHDHAVADQERCDGVVRCREPD